MDLVNRAQVQIKDAVDPGKVLELPNLGFAFTEWVS